MRRSLLRVGSLLAIATCVSVSSYAADSLTPEKRQDIEALLQETGTLKVAQILSEATVKELSKTIRNVRPDIPAHVLELVAKEVNGVIADEMGTPGGLVDLMTQLYHRYFTHDEVKALLAFYRTPVGKKAGALAPVMSQEGFEIGQRWGQSLAPKIMQRVKGRLQEEGIEL